MGVILPIYAVGGWLNIGGMCPDLAKYWREMPILGQILEGGSQIWPNIGGVFRFGKFWSEVLIFGKILEGGTQICPNITEVPRFFQILEQDLCSDFAKY